MNILVYDVAADGGGAATILSYYYRLHQQDRENHYYYLLSTYPLKNAENITVIHVPEVKKNWINRVLFDLYGAKKYLKQYEIHEVFSLQNNTLPCFPGRQVVYVHNALPFSEKKYGLFESRYLWIYQNVIGRLIKRSIRKADKVIVQTNWMKEEVCAQTGVRADKVEVSFPQFSYDAGYRYQEEELTTFFYPANAFEFKNHQVIIDACLRLKQAGFTQYRVVFTLTGAENPSIAKLKAIAEQNGLPIEWTGTMDKEHLFAAYAASVLLFPSFIETIGLPILEAMSVGAPIIAADTKYAREVVGGYQDAVFFSPTDAGKLADIMSDYSRRTVNE